MIGNSDEWHHENNIDNYRRRRDIAEQIMDVMGCTYDPKQVGMFLWGKIPERYADVEDLTEKVLHEARVFITPGLQKARVTCRMPSLLPISGCISVAQSRSTSYHLL